MKHYLTSLSFPLKCFLTWIAFTLFFSCKKEEPFNASINFIYPYENSVFYFLDTLNVRVGITANKTIDRVQIQLRASDNSPACPAIFVSNISDNQVEVNEFYPLVNNYLPTSSNYRLEVLVASGEETVKLYRLLTVNEIPKTIKAFYGVIKSNGGNDLYRIDSSGTNSLLSIGNDFMYSAISSRFQTISYNGATSTGFYLLNANNLNQINNIPSNQQPQSTFFAAQYDASTHLYFLSNYDGSIKGISTETGSTQFLSSENAFFIPHTIFKCSNYLFTVSTDRITGVDKLQVLFYPSGSPRQSIDAPFEIINIIEKDFTNYWVFANSNGNGRIYSYSIPGNGFSLIHDFGSNTISDVLNDNDGNKIIATQNGVYRFNGVISPVRITNSFFSRIIKEDVNDGYFGVSGLNVKALDQSLNVINIFNFPDSVRNFMVLYSK